MEKSELLGGIVGGTVSQALNARYSLMVTFKDGEGELKPHIVNTEPLDLAGLNRYITPLVRYRREWHITDIDIVEVQEARRPWTPELKAMYDREMLRQQVGEVEGGGVDLPFEQYFTLMRQVESGATA